MGSLRRAIAVAVAVSVSGAFSAVTGPRADAVASPAVEPGAVRPAHTVTLITGDVARLGTTPDGRPMASIDGERPDAYQTVVRDGDVYLFPDAALPYVATGQLDEALFNLTDLVAQGYDDASSGSLPLLLAAPAGSAAKAEAGTGGQASATLPGTPPPAPPGAIKRAELRSVGATAVAEEKARAATFWQAIAGDAVRPLTAGRKPRLGGGIGKVWLDRRMHATLADSVPQIGAPAAWAAGYDGTGVKVAVLDSGYDPTHPDLAGRVVASADFTGTGSVVDRHGHGTHVAATVAGTGAAAGGTRKGVAPGAQLLIGKVLDDSGTGDLSWGIAGMEWAVAQGARIVSLSLGAGPSNGTDILSEAVNNLSASSGALFVVAAGNRGPAESTVETPGTATAALTVGAVSKQDEVADRSARGPRLGDGAVKPELTAPGVDIIAARAAGTSLGQLVDDRYTAMSGTSMAAPHVAGAAALLAQQHPQWRAGELKAALVGSAHPLPDAPAVAVGAGRLDVAAAVRARVQASAASIGFGRLTYTGDPVTAEVTYRNTGDVPVTLNLGAQAKGPGGAPAAIAVTPRRLTIAPGQQATATVRVDPAGAQDGAYTGMLVARGADTSVRTPIGYFVEGPRYTLTVSAVDHAGRPAQNSSHAELWNLDTGELTLMYYRGADAQVTVPAGRYSLMTYIYDYDENGWERATTVLGDPQLTLDRDRTVHFDARQSTELRVDTPEQAEPRATTIAWQRTMGEHSVISGWNVVTPANSRYYTAQTAPVSEGTFEFIVNLDLAEPELTAKVVGKGGWQLHSARPVEDAPLLDGRRRLRLVDAGDGTAKDLARPEVAGSAVLLHVTDMSQLPDRLIAAAKAGAELVLLRPDGPGFWHASVGLDSKVPVPAYTLEFAEAQRLRDQIASQRTVTLDLSGEPESPYHYQLLLPYTGGIPAGRRYDSRKLPLATVESKYHDVGETPNARDTWLGITPTALAALPTTRQFRPPLDRTFYLTTGSAKSPITWRHDAVAASIFPGNPMGQMFGRTRTYRAGERTSEEWFPALTRPAVPRVEPDLAYGAPVNRWHDAFRIAIPAYASGTVDQYGWVDASNTGRLALYRNGTLVGETAGPQLQLTVPPGAATYRLTLDVARDRNDGPTWWTTSTATSSAWTFRSAQPDSDDPEVLPLVQVEYQLDTDMHNAVRARHPYQLVLRPGYQPGYGRHGLFDVRVEVSYDDGQSWAAVRTHRGHGGATVARFSPAPAGAGFASLRVTAADQHGNSLVQTITRAWRLE